MKKLLIFILGIAIFQSCTTVVTPNEDAHYINEDFILLDKYEENMIINGDTRTVRTWKIQQITSERTDSVMIAEIDDKDANGCGIITDDLWHKRNVGDILHFDYIRKDRFFQVKNIAHDNWGGYVDGEYTTRTEIITPEPVEFKAVPPKLINLTKIQIESRILEIDREIMGLERELEMLIESQK